MIPMFEEADPAIRKTIEILHEIDDWPVDHGKDVVFLERMRDVYPMLNLVEEAAGYAAWLSEHERKKKVKHRARFRNWLRNADRWRERPRGRHHRAETEGFGETGRTSW